MQSEEAIRGPTMPPPATVLPVPGPPYWPAAGYGAPTSSRIGNARPSFASWLRHSGSTERGTAAGHCFRLAPGSGGPFVPRTDSGPSGPTPGPDPSGPESEPEGPIPAPLLVTPVVRPGTFGPSVAARRPCLTRRYGPPSGSWVGWLTSHAGSTGPPTRRVG